MTCLPFAELIFRNTPMKIVYLIFSLGFFVLFIIKILIHIFLDYQNGYQVKAYSIDYMLPYGKVVDKRYKALVTKCNIIYKVSLLLFVLTLIVLLEINFSQRIIRIS